MTVPKILIVDDSLTVRMDLAEALGTAGISTVTCATAAEARATLAGEPIGLVILDVLLPDADGVDLLREIRANPPTSALPVLLLTTEVDVRDRVRGLSTGADEYVGKPYDVRYLVARATELLRCSADSDALNRRSVLVIDDSISLREGLRSAFEESGYSVMTAESGEEGLLLAADERPNAVVVDGALPGIDGATVIRRIRLDAALRHTPCLLLTGSEDEGAELRALDSGADAFVRKSEDLSVILARLGAIVRTATRQPGELRTASLLGPKKILAVDDSDTYLHALAEALRGEGFDVILAHSGEEALELLAITSVDCVLLDLLMPGIGGRETCARIKQAPGLRDIPLIMLTALEERDAMIEGLGAGADDYIAKSADFHVLKARVRAQLRRRQFEEEARGFRERLMSAELETAQARAARELAEARAELVEELERKNKELESFCYSVSHDLRAPLRAIDGFSNILLEELAEALGDDGRDYLRRIRAAAQRMGVLIDDLLELSRVGLTALSPERVDLSAMARQIVEMLYRATPQRKVGVTIQDGVFATVDPRLGRVLLQNLLENSWKFTSHVATPHVEFGLLANGPTALFVRDNGAGFDMAYADKLFAPFQRLHSEQDFPGTGVGLATVQRIVERHGGRVWAEGEVGRGARVLWTLPEVRMESSR